LKGNIGRTRPEHLSRPRSRPAAGPRSAQPHAMRLVADRRALRGAHRPLYRDPQPVGPGRARGNDVEDQRGPAVLLPTTRVERRGCGVADRQRLLQGSPQGTAHGVRGRGAKAARREPRRQRRLMPGTAPMLEIRNLHARLPDGREILRAIDLKVAAGEVHAIMGPNGSGKSTLAAVLAGRDGYEVSEGAVTYLGHDLLTMAADERAREGLFLAFQYPVEIPGVNNM